MLPSSSFSTLMNPDPASPAWMGPALHSMPVASAGLMAVVSPVTRTGRGRFSGSGVIRSNRCITAPTASALASTLPK